MEKTKTCNRIEIKISYFEDRHQKLPFLISYTPMTRDYYTGDAFKQGGVMRKYAFKEGWASTLEKVIDKMEEVMREAAKEDIDVSILRDGHSMTIGNEWRNKSSGMIHFNGKYIHRNRQLNDEELDIIYKALKERLHDLYPKE